MLFKYLFVCVCLFITKKLQIKSQFDPFHKNPIKFTGFLTENLIPCGRYTVEEDMEMINFISKNKLHGRILGTKMYKWAAVSLSK